MSLPLFHDSRFALAALLIKKKRIKSLSFDFFSGLFFHRAPKASDAFLYLGARLATQGKLGNGQTPESFAALRHKTFQEKRPKTLEALYAAMPAVALRDIPSFYAKQEALAAQVSSFACEDALKLAVFAAKEKASLFLITDSLLPTKTLQLLLKKKAPDFPTQALFLSTAKTGLKNKKALLEKTFGSQDPSACLYVGHEEPAALTNQAWRWLDPLADVNRFSDLMDSELPSTWTERAPFFASTFGDGGLSFLRARAGFAELKKASAQERAFFFHGARILSGIIVPFAAWAATRLQKEGIESLFAPTQETRFLASLVHFFAPKISIEETPSKKGGPSWLIALDESSFKGFSSSHVLALFSTEASFSLQEKGCLVEGFLTQNKNPYDLDAAWSRASFFIKAFCSDNSPFDSKDIAAARKGVSFITECFSLLNPDLTFLTDAPLALHARAAARRLLFCPTETELLWLREAASSYDVCDPPFAEGACLWPPEQERLRLLCDQAIEKSAISGSLDNKVWMALFLQPTVSQRLFLNHYLAARIRELGRNDLFQSLYRQLWSLGQRDFKTFRITWPLFRKERPDLSTWQFLKEAACAAEEKKDIDYLITVQNESHGMTYRGYYAQDEAVPFQDSAITRGLKAVLSPLRPVLRPIAPLEKRPLRLCLVMGGEAAKRYSPVSDTLFNTAKAFNRDRTELSFASVQFKPIARATPDTNAWLEELAPVTKKLFFRQQGLPLGQAILRLAQEIAQEGFDALLFSSPTNARLALAALRPAPVLGSFGFGWPELYTSPFLDFTAQWTDYPSLGCLCSSFRVPDSMPEGRFHLPANPLSRSAISIPEDAVIVLSSGRPIKYHEPFYWRIVTTILKQRPKTHFVFVGPTYDGMRDWLKSHVNDALLPNLHFLGYRRDHAEVLACADIILDTIPVGGGFNLTEAMNLGLPTVLCRNKAEDLFAPYDNRFMLPTGEILMEPSLNFARDDFEGICGAVIRLIDQPKERKRLSKAMRETAALRKNARKSADAIEALVRKHLAAKIKRGA